MEQQLYTPQFFEFHQEGMIQSARAVLPLVLQQVQPQSVVDVGCGAGAWLRVLQELGITDYLGVDGDYVDQQLLQIPPQHFLPRDLKQPLHLDRTFDLALCLEVGEHLPSQAAMILVDSLTRLSPVVLFSAAIPFQGGDGHINEQWPDYWVERFQQRGYVVVDSLRAHLWNQPQVKAWYAQNCLFFVRQEQLEAYPALWQAWKSDRPQQRNLVHPDTYLRVVKWLQTQLQQAQVQLQQAQQGYLPALPSENTQDLNINPQELLNLYLRQQWDRLSEKLLRVLQHFETATYLSVGPNEQYIVDVWAKTFLFLFSQPDYRISDAYALQFVQHNAVIANLVAISSFKTTDGYVQLLGSQPDNLVKILTLYSARNTLRIDRKLFFDTNPQLASIWYCQFYRIYHSTCVNRATYQHLKDHLAYVDDRLAQVSQFHHVCFAATYIDPEKDRILKQQINQTLQQQFTQAAPLITNQPHPRRIAVITNTWHRGHSVYRNQYHFLESLVPDYELVLIHLGPMLTDLDVSLFKEIRTMQLVNDVMAIDAIQTNDFVMAYFPDVGMNMESILLSNLRLAPLQVTSYGHSVSTFGSKVDYFIGSAEVELLERLDHNYSERVVLIPGLGITNLKPNYQVQGLTHNREEVIINCSWYPQKMNYPMMQVLQEILTHSNVKIRFRFFCGGGLVEANHFVPFVRDVAEMFGPEAAEVVQGLPYNQYMALMEEGDFCLDAYHFGGCNTVVDSLYLGKPIVTYAGEKWYNRIGSQMLRQVNLPELITTNRRDYVRLALQLIHQPDYRAKLQATIRQLDLEATLFNRDSSRYFRQAIDYLISHRDRLLQDTSRQPIVIPRTEIR